MWSVYVVWEFEDDLVDYAEISALSLAALIDRINHFNRYVAHILSIRRLSYNGHNHDIQMLRLSSIVH
jgi:hypothetical protein